MDRSGRAPRWGWFTAWMIVGAGYAFGFLSFAGLFVLPIMLLITVLLLRIRAPSPSIGVQGLVSGLGLPILYIAWINREGPGEVCHTTATENFCVSEWSPWPWLVAGLILVATGLTMAVIKRRQRNFEAGSRERKA